MAKQVTNSVGEEILADPGNPDNPAEHPSGDPEKTDDQVAGMTVGDAEVNDPPLRTNRPDVPIIQRLGTGAGEHQPVTDEDWDGEGRFIKQEEEEEKSTRSSRKAADGEKR